MEKINYQLELEKTIKLNKDKKTSLLLHSCCAPCSSYVLEYLSNYFNITLFFYNPNISPESEFVYRVQELTRFVKESKSSADIIIGNYNENEFYETAKGYEELPEGGERCFRCYRLRLNETAKKAKELNFDYFTTTLSISPYKNSNMLNLIGNELEKEYGVKYLYSDFKKKNGYKRSIELSKEYALYRQDYCGCIYSKIQAERKKNEKMY